jgi:hypothetical protein
MTMSMVLPAGARATVRLFLISAAQEEITIDLPGIRYLPPLDDPIDPMEFLRLVRWPGLGRIRIRGTWRFMSDREVDAYLAREEGDGFNPHGSGPMPVETR